MWFFISDDILILESPILPVMEGDTVALSCLYKEEDQVEITTNLSAVFYKDDVFIGTEPAGKMIIRDVSKSHEGSYKCGNSRHGKSLQSLLTVKGDIGFISVKRLDSYAWRDVSIYNTCYCCEIFILIQYELFLR